jgi:hypothetical protein
MNIGPPGWEADETLDVSSERIGDSIRVTATGRTSKRLIAAKIEHLKKLMDAGKLVLLTNDGELVGYILAPDA